MPRLFLGSSLGLALAAAFMASARAVDIARDISLDIGRIPSTTDGGRGHYRDVQERHNFQAGRHAGPNLRGRAPQFNKYAHF